ncbi:MAG: O-antigen ligase family protein [Clostridiales bacterium]|nr:O-antigen ligase family protein [Clostridiales bacterium]
MVYIYGFGLFTFAFADMRLGEEVSRINSLGMSLAYGAVFSFYYFYIHNRKLMLFFVVSLAILSSFTGSRKAIVIIVIGIFAILIQEFKFNKKRLFRNIIIIIIVAIALSSLSYFDMVLNRFDGILSMLKGESGADGSANIRYSMIVKGLDLFWERPLTGSGLATYEYYWSDNISARKYSHNNYVELLVNGGIVAIIIYYGNYLYLFFSIISKRSKISIILVVMIGITLIVDMFIVSYYSKDIYIMIAIYYSYVYNYKISAEEEIKLGVERIF